MGGWVACVVLFLCRSHKKSGGSYMVDSGVCFVMKENNKKDTQRTFLTIFFKFVYLFKFEKLFFCRKIFTTSGKITTRPPPPRAIAT